MTSKEKHFTSEDQFREPKPVYNLEERTFLFAKEIRKFVKTLPRTTANLEDGRQLIRASGSVGANYIEANEALGAKDFLMRVRISRKEAKECTYFLRLIYETNPEEFINEGKRLLDEATQLKKILSKIIENSK